MKNLWIDTLYLDEALWSTFPLLLIDRLCKDGYETHLMVPSIKKKEKITTSLSNKIVYVPTIRLPVLSNLSFYLMLLFYLPNTIKKIKPRVIIVDIDALPGVVPVLLFYNIKLIIDIRTSFIFYKGIRGYIQKIHNTFLITLAKLFCDCITVTSSALKEELCNIFRVRPQKIKVLTNGVSLDLFDLNKYKNSSKNLKKRLKLEGKFVVMYHGSLGIGRGLIETIKAIQKVATKYPEIFFLILGSGGTQFQTKLYFTIKNKSLEDNVYIHKAVNHSEVPKFISICDVGIVPLDTFSYPRTSCPLKLLEYLAMKKNVIATDIPFSREILKHGECIILIPSNSSEDIARAIEYVYKNRAALKRMGEIGRAIVEQKYTWKKKAEELASYIGALVK